MSAAQATELKCPKCGHDALCQTFYCNSREEINNCIACGYYEEWKLEREVDETGESRIKLDEQGKATMAHTEFGPFGSLAFQRLLDPGVYTTLALGTENTDEELLALADEATSNGGRVHFLSQWKDGQLTVLIGSLDDLHALNRQ
jgi:Zn ribbon nucleic-acid-binding protein